MHGPRKQNGVLVVASKIKYPLKLKRNFNQTVYTMCWFLRVEMSNACTHTSIPSPYRHGLWTSERRIFMIIYTSHEGVLLLLMNWTAIELNSIQCWFFICLETFVFSWRHVYNMGILKKASPSLYLACVYNRTYLFTNAVNIYYRYNIHVRVLGREVVADFRAKIQYLRHFNV